jgi:hypothetical protein
MGMRHFCQQLPRLRDDIGFCTLMIGLTQLQVAANRDCHTVSDIVCERCGSSRAGRLLC